MTTEAVLWEWLNAFSDASTRAVAVEGYRRAHADARGAGEASGGVAREAYRRVAPEAFAHGERHRHGPD